ncbi:hypothetical protein B5K11_09570 [Rhizobium leguminosarum bv. trifolii]|uniref:hypothetical protein n=1 Tax=Rhizobium leguminosarum TaxID=384 RepID=UPI000E2F3D26|nr:hypothetical protein [Rhizobium leguminosarum]RFB95194.1 hypothetical protein B5K11_09570 [Rhizobium leguminosarum bv. trifolii]
MMAVRLTENPIFANIGRGQRVDIGLADPRVVDFSLMASALAKQARFDARHEGPHALSAAQHAVQGAQAIVRETNDMRLAGLFLLRDGHQLFLGGRSRPAEQLLQVKCGTYLDLITRQIEAAWDAAIYQAAGMQTPDTWTKATHEALQRMDVRMTRAEAITLFGERAAVDFPKVASPLTVGSLHPWPASKAEVEFILFLQRATGRADIGRG